MHVVQIDWGFAVSLLDLVFFLAIAKDLNSDNSINSSNDAMNGVRW